jgi:DNA polymerase III alpha subunit
MSTSKKVKEFVDDARRSGVEMRPPSIERSVWEFEPEGDALRYGFGRSRAPATRRSSR